MKTSVSSVSHWVDILDMYWLRVVQMDSFCEGSDNLMVSQQRDLVAKNTSFIITICISYLPKITMLIEVNGR